MAVRQDDRTGRACTPTFHQHTSKESSMKSALYGLFAVLVAFAAAPAWADEPAPNKIRVLLTYGGHEFEEAPLWAMFDALPNVQYTKAPMPESAAMLKPGLEKQYDVIVMYDMVPQITPEQQKAFVELLQRGIGVVSLHHNMGANRDWSEFAKLIGGKFCHQKIDIGGKDYGPSGWEHDQEIAVSVADKTHPITQGIADFTIHDEVYNHYYVAPDVHVLLTTDNPKNDPKIAWVKDYGNSRVFYLMLGHDSKAWQNPAYPELLARGIRWAARQ